MRLVEVAPGAAVVAMAVRDDMVNGWGSAHGGLVASLADSAFAVACNSYGEVTVAAGFDVTFLEPARPATSWWPRRRGARAARPLRPLRRRRRPRADGVVVAELRGRSRSLGRPIAG